MLRLLIASLLCLAGSGACCRALSSAPSLGDAYLAFSLFAAKVRCGHTYPNFYNQPKAIAEALFEHNARVPFQFCWLDQRMVITKNQSDGGNDGKRVNYLEVHGFDDYEAFDIYLPLFYPQIGHEQLLSVRSPSDADVRSAQVTGLTRAQRLAGKSMAAKEANAGWSLQVRPDSIAVLESPNWALYNSDFDWKEFLRSSFVELQQRDTPALVIDLRRNEGGLDFGDVLLALRPYLDTWDPSFNDWGAPAAFIC